MIRFDSRVKVREAGIGRSKKRFKVVGASSESRLLTPHHEQRFVYNEINDFEGQGFIHFGIDKRPIGYALSRSIDKSRQVFEGIVTGNDRDLVALNDEACGTLVMADGQMLKVSVKRHDPFFDYCYVVGTVCELVS